MSSPAPRSLLAFDRDHAVSVNYVQRLWDALSREVEGLVGRSSSNSLFTRLFSLSPREVRTLRQRIDLPTLAQDRGHASRPRPSSDELVHATETMAIRFDMLLTSMIGSEMTAGLFLSAVIAANQDTFRPLEHRTANRP